MLGLVLLILSVPVQAAIFGALVPATDYYVDGTSGSDLNNGTSVSTPFQTIAKVQSVLTAGKSAAVYGGNVTASPITYREQLTLPANNITIRGWGLAKPRFDCSEPISAGAWTKTGGFTNIYQASVTTAESSIGLVRLWENGTAFFQATSMANLDATASRFFTTGGGTSYTMFVHASNDSDPSVNGKLYEYNKRSLGIFSGATTKVRVSWAETRRNLSNNGSFEVGAGSSINSVDMNDGTKHNGLLHAGTSWSYVTLADSYYAGQAKIAAVLNDNTPSSSDHATFNTVSYVETLETTGIGFYGHTNSGGLYGTVTMVNCSTVGAASSVDGFAAGRVVIDGGAFNSGIVMGGSTTVLKNATVAGQISIGYSSSAEIDTVTINSTITNGAIYMNGAVSPSVNIHDSTIINAIDYDIYVGLSVTPASFISLRNTFGQGCYICGPGVASLFVAGISTINTNTYHYPGTMAFPRTPSYDFAVLGNWQAWQALGYDAAGTRTTP